MTASTETSSMTMFTCVLLAACAATNNPRVGDVRPLPPEPAKAAAPEAAATPAVSTAPVAQEAPAKPPPAPAPSAPKPLVLGTVGGEPIDVRDFLARLWTRDHRVASETLEQIVFARLAMNEADRLGLVLDPARVDAVLAKTLAALQKKLTDSGSKSSLDEYIRTNLELEPDYYKARLRGEAVEHLLAERCVRAWFFENERRDVQLTEVRDESVLPKIRAALDAGRPFEDVAREFGLGEDEATQTTTRTLVRAENNELARAAFATAVGAVAGPLAQSNRWLFMRIATKHEPTPGSWMEIGARVEQSLTEQPVQDLDYLQWRAAMVRRYQVDFDPFLDAVTGKKP